MNEFHKLVVILIFMMLVLSGINILIKIAGTIGFLYILITVMIRIVQTYTLINIPQEPEVKDQGTYNKKLGYRSL